MKDENRNVEPGTEVEVVEKSELEAMDKLMLKLRKPYEFEGEIINEVDLSGLNNITSKDMIAVNKRIERGGTINVLPEMTLEYAVLMASRVTGRPVEFFEGFPPQDGMMLKNMVTNFLFGQG